MGTRGIVAVAEAGSWRGFYNHYDSYPDGLGEQLLAAFRKHGLEKSVEKIRAARLIDGAKERATPAEFADNGDLEWFYLLEPSTGVLRVFTGGIQNSPFAPTGFKHLVWREVATFTLAANGASKPAQMNFKLPPPWLDIPELEGWPDDDAAAAMRHDVRRRLERDALAAGFTVEGLYALYEQALSEAFFHAPWPGPANPDVYLPSHWGTESRWLTVSLAGLRVHYASRVSWRVEAPKLELFCAPDLECSVPHTREDVFVHSAQPRVLHAISISALPNEKWLYALLDALRARRVPDPRGAELIRLATPAAKADDWRVFYHPDGRVWSIRPSTGGFQLRLGAPDDDPVFKERKGDMNALIAEQVADGFVEAAVRSD